MKKILFITLSIILSAPTFGADGNYKKAKNVQNAIKKGEKYLGI